MIGDLVAGGKPDQIVVLAHVADHLLERMRHVGPAAELHVDIPPEEPLMPGKKHNDKAAAPPPAEVDKLLNLLVDTVEDYAIFLVDPQGNIASWNPGVGRMLGYDEAAGEFKGLADAFVAEAGRVDALIAAARG